MNRSKEETEPNRKRMNRPKEQPKKISRKSNRERTASERKETQKENPQISRQRKRIKAADIDREGMNRLKEEKLNYIQTER